MNCEAVGGKLRDGLADCARITRKSRWIRRCGWREGDDGSGWG